MKASENPRSQIGRCSDVGQVRSANEDNLGDLPVLEGHVLIVADGMGGYRGGALASSLVVQAIEEFFRDVRIDDPSKVMRQAIRLANERIYQRGQQEEELSRMGSTCVLAVVLQNKLYTAHVGDSRIYLLRKGGKLQRLTRDHTVVQYFVDAGMLSQEEAEGHPDSHILSRALGPRAYVEPEICESSVEMQEGDRILLCSDGLTKMLKETEIHSALAKPSTAQQVAEALVKIANDHGGEDNVTVLIYEFLSYDPSLKFKPKAETSDPSERVDPTSETPPYALPALSHLPLPPEDLIETTQLHPLDPAAKKTGSLEPPEAASPFASSSPVLPPELSPPPQKQPSSPEKSGKKSDDVEFLDTMPLPHLKDRSHSLEKEKLLAGPPFGGEPHDLDFPFPPSHSLPPPPTPSKNPQPPAEHEKNPLTKDELS